MRDENVTLKALNIFALVAMVAVNAMAQFSMIGGMSTAEVSALYPTLLTPAGITFSIWAVIYLLLTYFVIQQIITDDDSATRTIGSLFAITCALNITWIFLWQYKLLLPATAVIIALWAVLLMIYRKLDRRQRIAKGIFSIYLAWITVATSAAIYLYLSTLIPTLHLEVPSVMISAAVLLILTGVGLYMTVKRENLPFGITSAWAIAGVFLSHATPMGYNGMYPIMIAVSLGCALSLIIASLWQASKSIRLSKPKVEM